MKKILIIDDDKSILKAIKTILRHEGYSVDIADNGENGFKKIASVKPDLIICDLNLPDTDGLEIVNWIKKIKKELPIIILSARDKGKDILKGYTSKADYYITKPFTHAQLLYGIKLMLKS
jgi:two-component system alkaline phosphatase synthesis response regulator PhoP